VVKVEDESAVQRNTAPNIGAIRYGSPTSVRYLVDGAEFIYFYLFRAVNLNGCSPVWCGKFKYRTDAVN